MSWAAGDTRQGGCIGTSLDTEVAGRGTAAGGCLKETAARQPAGREIEWSGRCAERGFAVQGDDVDAGDVLRFRARNLIVVPRSYRSKPAYASPILLRVVAVAVADDEAEATVKKKSRVGLAVEDHGHRHPC